MTWPHTASCPRLPFCDACLLDHLTAHCRFCLSTELPFPSTSCLSLALSELRGLSTPVLIRFVTRDEFPFTTQSFPHKSFAPWLLRAMLKALLITTCKQWPWEVITNPSTPQRITYTSTKFLCLLCDSSIRWLWWGPNISVCWGDHMLMSSPNMILT